MKRYSVSVYVIALALLLGFVSSPSMAVLPVPDGNVPVQMYQGWFHNRPTWYIRTTTNDISYAQGQNLTLAPKLSSAIGSGAQPIFIVTNFQQGPVFPIIPTGSPSIYSGLWQVNTITWLPGSTPRPITNDLPAGVGNPNGIPTSGVAVVTTGVVVDYPILIVGPLGAPAYKIPQLVSVNTYNKIAVLPFFNAFSADKVTKKVSIVPTIITESSNIFIAPLVKANFALGLALVGLPDSENAWLFAPPPVLPPSQLPIIESIPTALSWRNTNFDYSPVDKGHLLFKTGAAQSTIVNNPTTLAILLGSGAITQIGTSTLNVQVIQGRLQ